MRIKFSHIYEKMPRDFQFSRLLDVIAVRLEDLSEAFLMYDTEYLDGGELRQYKLPRRGNYMILILRSGSGNGRLWTTIRRTTDEKRTYYRSHIGDVFECVVNDQ